MDTENNMDNDSDNNREKKTRYIRPTMFHKTPAAFDCADSSWKVLIWLTSIKLMAKNCLPLVVFVQIAFQNF